MFSKSTNASRSGDSGRGAMLMQSPRAVRRNLAGRVVERELYILTGCTGVGKTHWSIRWARRYGAEIISCDSLLFYRGMDIGTAKPTSEERAAVRHHLIDVCEVQDRMDIARYVQMARAAADEIWAGGRRVLVCGGSGFYLRSFLRAVVDEVEIPAEVRGQISRMDAEEAKARLRALNPDGLGDFAVDNPRRVIRALERCLASGKTVTQLAADFARLPAPFSDAKLSICELARAPEALARRLEIRAEKMLRDGLVAEVEKLHSAGLGKNPSAAQAIGYREVVACLEGKLPRSRLLEEITKDSRALVKKQRTWFRTQLPGHPVIDAEALCSEEELFPPG